MKTINHYRLKLLRVFSPNPHNFEPVANNKIRPPPNRTKPNQLAGRTVNGGWWVNQNYPNTRFTTVNDSWSRLLFWAAPDSRLFPLPAHPFYFRELFYKIYWVLGGL